MIRVHKEVLFSLMHSHSKLSQTEYHYNPSYNDSHFSAIAEQNIIKDLTPETLTEYFDYVNKQEGLK